MSRNIYYRLDENNVASPCSAAECNEFLESDQRFIRQETVTNEKDKTTRWISTVFLGINHQSEFDSEPALFETMVFPGEENLTEEYMERYSTYEQALEGHQKAVKWVEDGCDVD